VLALSISARHRSHIPPNRSLSGPQWGWDWQSQPGHQLVAPRSNALGEYLRARREQLRPEDVGLAAGTRRRVPGLRREKVATLVGMSPAYYLRLEQGRDTNPSTQIVDALAQAIRLDDKGIDCLHRVATATAKPRFQSTGSGVAGLGQLIDQIPLPAVVLTSARWSWYRAQTSVITPVPSPCAIHSWPSSSCTEAASRCPIPMRCTS
jgi:transcriptional regulator with XRE-family HTH domain